MDYSTFSTCDVTNFCSGSSYNAYIWRWVHFPFKKNICWCLSGPSWF